MALDKIKKANKKARHQSRRKQAHKDFRKREASNKVRQKKMRKMFIEGKREHLAARRGEALKELEGGLPGGES